MELMDATVFRYANKYRNCAFEEVLNACIIIYFNLVAKSCQYPNNENRIRDAFGRYLKDDDFKNATYPLMYYNYEAEAAENEGFLDIKIQKVNPYEGSWAYFIIECKRIDGSKRLNKEYIANGICRFVSSYYSTYYGCNGMFGFVVKSLDINQNVGEINSMLQEEYLNDKGETVNSHALLPISRCDVHGEFDYSYYSVHSYGKDITLYHLMFDFSQMIRDDHR
jgi:hypothetical protein